MIKTNLDLNKSYNRGNIVKKVSLILFSALLLSSSVAPQERELNVIESREESRCLTSNAYSTSNNETWLSPSDTTSPRCASEVQSTCGYCLTSLWGIVCEAAEILNNAAGARKYNRYCYRYSYTGHQFTHDRQHTHLQ